MVKNHNNERREAMEEPDTFEFIPPEPERIYRYKRKHSNAKRVNNDMNASIFDRRQERLNELGFATIPRHRDVETFVEEFWNRPITLNKSSIRKHAKK